jgi:hypothetical protein
VENSEFWLRDRVKLGGGVRGRVHMGIGLENGGLAFPDYNQFFIFTAEKTADVK